MDLKEYNEEEFKAKQKELSFKKLIEIRKLYEEKRRIVEDYDNRIELAILEREKIMNAQYVDRESSFKAISYLVSNIEGEDYHVVKVPVKLFEKKVLNNYVGIVPVDYELSCLVRDGCEEEAIKEIRDRFAIKPSMGNFYSYDDYCEINKFLNMPSDNYVQLAYYKPKEDGKSIFYNRSNELCIKSLPVYQLDSKICDERYGYIVDYMNTVVDTGLWVVGFEVDDKGMRILADMFVNSYKKGYVRKKSV